MEIVDILVLQNEYNKLYDDYLRLNRESNCPTRKKDELFRQCLQLSSRIRSEWEKMRKEQQHNINFDSNSLMD